MGLQDKLSGIRQTREVGKLLADVCEILDKLEGIGCYIERTGNRWKVSVDDSSSLPTPTTEYKVLTVTDTAGIKSWIEDYVRWP